MFHSPWLGVICIQCDEDDCTSQFHWKTDALAEVHKKAEADGWIIEHGDHGVTHTCPTCAIWDKAKKLREQVAQLAQEIAKLRAVVDAARAWKKANTMNFEPLTQALAALDAEEGKS